MLCLSAQAVCLSVYFKCCSYLGAVFTHWQQWHYSDASHFICSTKFLSATLRDYP